MASWLEKIGMGSAKPVQQPSPQAAQAAATQQQNPAAPQADPNAATKLANVDPFAQFKMWDTVKTDPTDKAPEFNLDDAALDGAVQQLDFTRGLDPTVKAAAEAGDSKAIMQMMKHSNAQAYKYAMQHSSTLTGRFTEARETYRDKSFGSKVRGELTAEAMADTPNYSNPAVRKQLGIWATELQRQHPDSSPREIAKMAKDYLAELSGSVAPKDASKAKAPAGKTDWGTYFDDASEDGPDFF